MNNETERDAFEAWYVEEARLKGVDFTKIAELREGNHYGESRYMLNGKWEGWQARAAISPATERAAPPHFDVEAMLVACVPGGSSCDPQRVSDAIREYCASHPQPTERSAELEAVQRDAWRPIETAPKDGTAVLLCWATDADGEPFDWRENPKTAGVFVQVASWWEGDNDWIVYCSMIREPSLHFSPTHWMPIPPAPIAAAPQKGDK